MNALFQHALSCRLPQAPVSLWRCIALLWGAGRNTAEIAQVLGITEAAIHNSLPHARAAYRDGDPS